MLTQIIGSLCKSMVRVKADTAGVPSHDPSSSPFSHWPDFPVPEPAFLYLRALLGQGINILVAALKQ